MLRRGLSLIAILTTLSWGAEKNGPESLPAFQKGEEALSSQLWEVAAARFTAALETPDLDPSLRPPILLRLAEAQVRGDRTDDALKTLDDPALKEDPARPFWTAQALAGSGRFADAVATLDQGGLEPKSPYLDEALVTKAGILRALGNSDGALATIDQLLERKPKSTRARLLKAEILIEQQHAEDALEVLPDPSGLKGPEASHTAYLRAQSLLEKGDAAAAIEAFEKLLESPEGQSLTRFHSITLGLARARLATGDREAAGDGLLAFIQQNPRSPLLDEAFDLLLDCLPEQPAPNDAILTRMREWIPASFASAPAILAATNGAISAWPTAVNSTDPLAPEALFHLALGLRREGSAESRLTARSLLTRLRLSHPDHPLVARALLESGRWDLEDGRRHQAAACFDALDRLGNASPPELRAQGLSLEGAARFNEGDFEGAAAAFDRASDLLESEQRLTARLNAATALLAGGSLVAFSQISEKTADPTLVTSLALERALFLSSFRDPEALPALRSFVELYPGHPRIHEARLAAALAALDRIPPDTDFAGTQLALLDPEARAKLPPASLALAIIRQHDRLGEAEKAIETANQFLTTYPDDPRRVEIQFELGRAQFQAGNYNAARLMLEKLAIDHPNSPQAEAALLISARAAALGATPQAQAESIAIFDKLIETDSPFADVARLEKADLLIKLSRLDDATETLLPWFQSLKQSDPLLLSVGLLLSDALFAKAEGKADALLKAVEVHDRLLADLPENSPARYRILYQKGRTLEQIPGREDEAIDTYYSVLESAAESPGGDWKSIELCGFGALQFLERSGRWPAAVKMAETIARLNGPRAEEAAQRAKALRLEHMIWPE